MRLFMPTDHVIDSVSAAPAWAVLTRCKSCQLFYVMHAGSCLTRGDLRSCVIGRVGLGGSVMARLAFTVS